MQQKWYLFCAVDIAELSMESGRGQQPSSEWWEESIQQRHCMYVGWITYDDVICITYMYNQGCIRESMPTLRVVVKTSLFGFDVTVWLQHLVLVPQMCSDR